jgi:HK97 gp10 family phage protein
MVGVVSFKILGGQNLEKRLRELGPTVAGNVGRRAMYNSARVVMKAMRAFVPVKTGDLKRSITSQSVRGYGSLMVRVIGFKSPGRYYAHLVEFGTIRSAAKPFIRPALDASAENAILEMGKSIFRGIEAAAIGKVLATLKEEE